PEAAGAVANLRARPAGAGGVGVVRLGVLVHVFVRHERLVRRVGVTDIGRHRPRRDVHRGGRAAWIGTFVVVVEEVLLVLVADLALPETFCGAGRRGDRRGGEAGGDKRERGDADGHETAPSLGVRGFLVLGGRRR